MAKKRKAARHSRTRRKLSMQLGEVRLKSFDPQTKRWITFETSETWQKPEELSEVDERLIEWGKWAREQPAYLGYPRRTAESRAGEGVRDKRSRQLEPTNLTAEEIEAIIVTLPGNLMLIAVKQYVWNDGSARQRARDLCVRYRQYHYLVEFLQYSVLSVLRYSVQKV